MHIIQVQIKTLELLLLKKDVPGAIAFVREKSRQLLEGEIEVNELIVTKQYYRTDYKNDTLPHLIVVKKTLHRGETPYELGQRVPYVIVIDKDVKTTGKHINNILKGELDSSVVAKIATTTIDGKPYELIVFHSLDRRI